VFLTLEDPRAKIQGSRDPLGVQPIWTRFGRRVVTNLTTVTDSVRGFTTLLLGRYFADQLVGEGAIAEQDSLSVFLRMEQICAYARYKAGDAEEAGRILGARRVRRFLDEGGTSVPIATDSSGFILSDQKTYGLWGLYTVSARVSGLVPDGPRGLMPEAMEFVESAYAPLLRPARDRLRTLLLRGESLSVRPNDHLFARLLAVMSPTLRSDESVFFAAFLRDAAHVESQHRSVARQRMIAELFRTHSDAVHESERAELAFLVEKAAALDPSLAEALRHIMRAEALLAVAEVIFALLLARSGQRVGAISNRLMEQWTEGVPYLEGLPFSDLEPVIREAVSEQQVALLRQIDESLRARAYDDAIVAILDLNAVVMAERQGAPWVRLEKGRLDVRFRGIEHELPAGEGLFTLWRNSYFLPSLKAITRQVEANGHGS